MVSDPFSVRNLRLVHGVSDRRGIRHWWLVLSVFAVDCKHVVIAAFERSLIWSLGQLPSAPAQKIARTYRVQDYRGQWS
jgi:hypothetical protein